MLDDNGLFKGHPYEIELTKKQFIQILDMGGEDVDKIVIYATYPIMRVVAEANVEKVIEGNLSEVWERTKNFSGIMEKRKPLRINYAM
jgi:predicted transcriptional regulator